MGYLVSSLGSQHVTVKESELQDGKIYEPISLLKISKLGAKPNPATTPLPGLSAAQQLYLFDEI
ncbi:15001_t:CDS:2 [Funneliformis mosseae]|uniref:15001_t:CDS:1 n=1 Tax=Funneliformis mosseae TaxID=27381 RepID=A0A9N9EY13_FUNMO|nr:15001_t:CDS:2 [Funneliformis mosseae]